MTSLKGRPSDNRVAVVGGGLAGVAAAAALAEQGLDVELFETRRNLGGRAGAVRDPKTGQWIDLCQHVAMGCCTNLADFCRRIGVADSFTSYRRLHFFGPDARRYDFSASRWLPAPLHLLPSLLRLGYLDSNDRRHIAGAMMQLVREPANNPQGDTTILEWLRRNKQSEAAISKFWSVVLVSALGETLDRASLQAARKVFVDGFLRSARAYELEVPQPAWGHVLDRRMWDFYINHNVRVHLRTAVKQIEGDAAGARSLVLADGSRREFDFFVLAVPWHRVGSLLSPPIRAHVPALRDSDAIESSPISAVHLWFDQPVSELPHAVLVDRLSQWVFNHGKQEGGPGYYCQVVISASRELRTRQRDHVLAQVRHEVADVWPATRNAELLRWRLITQPAAVFSVCPGVDRRRPAQETPIANLALAGDWTATGWPATMEGAVRSGYLAAEAILRTCGIRARLLAADLPPGWLARWMLSWLKRCQEPFVRSTLRALWANGS